MIGSRPKPNRPADELIPEPTCFSCLSFFSKPKTQHQSNDSHPHHSTSLGSNQPSNVTIIPLPEMEIHYLDIELDYADCLEDVCHQDDIIGVVGFHQNCLPPCKEFISISTRSEVNGLDCLRGYCFDRVLILNQFSEYSLKQLFKIEQILTIKLPSLELLLQAINDWQNLITKNQDELMADVILKLTLKIMMCGRDYYLTLNENYRKNNSLQCYHWANIGLNPRQDKILIQRVLNQMVVKQFCQLVDAKPKGDAKKMIEEMLEKQVRKNSKISSSSIHSKKGWRKSSKDSSDVFMDSFGEDSGEIVMVELPAQKKLRCYSADISDQALTSQQKDKEKMLLEEIYLQFS